MRTIKFRGKRKDNGEWIEGCYQRLVVYGVMRYFILPSAGLMFDDVMLKDVLIEVIPETIGQFTGLTDKNGKEIYEGDIVRTYKVRNDWGKIIKIETQFYLEYCDLANYNQEEASELEIIGNIHENSELLKKNDSNFE